MIYNYIYNLTIYIYIHKPNLPAIIEASNGWYIEPFFLILVHQTHADWENHDDRMIFGSLKYWSVESDAGWKIVKDR